MKRMNPVVGIACVMVLLFLPLRLAAQEQRVWLRDVFIGGHTARQFGEVGKFSEQICPGAEWQLGVSASATLRRPFHIAAATSFHHEQGTDCVNGLHRPPPENGTITFSQLGDSRGYPYSSSELHLAVGPTAPDGRSKLHIYGGAGMMWEKMIPFAVGGAVFAAGSRNVRVVVAYDRRWFDVPFETVTQEYLGGQLVSTTSVDREEAERHGTARIGLELRLR